MHHGALVGLVDAELLQKVRESLADIVISVLADSAEHSFKVGHYSAFLFF
jgi:hypothetical protein